MDQHRSNPVLVPWTVCNQSYYAPKAHVSARSKYRLLEGTRPENHIRIQNLPLFGKYVTVFDPTHR